MDSSGFQLGTNDRSLYTGWFGSVLLYAYATLHWLQQVSRLALWYS